MKRWGGTLAVSGTDATEDDHGLGLTIRYIPSGSIIVPGLSGSSVSYNRDRPVLSVFSRLSCAHLRIWR